MRMPPKPLSDLYYLQNFHQVIDWVAARYGDVLAPEEQAFIQHFRALPTASQALLVRMVMRKGEHFRQSKLNYQEIGDTALAAEPLLTLGWVRDDLALSLPELARLVRKDELLLLLAEQIKTDPAAASMLIVNHLSKLGKTELVERLTEAWPQQQSFIRWWPAAQDRLLSLTINALCERLRLLFFGTLNQGWADFVLADLGIFQYEQVTMDPGSRGFQNRQQLEQYLQLHACREAVEQGAPIQDALDQLAQLKPDSPWIQQRLTRLQFSLARQAERQGELSLALQHYTDNAHPEARQRQIRILELSADYATAHDLAMQALAAPRCEAEQQSLERVLPRLRKRLGQPLPGKAPAVEINRLDLRLPQPERQSVEIAVALHLNETDGPVHYVENTLINSLFGLLCWEAIFAPLPGAFFHPFQSGPADLYQIDFRKRRADLFAEALQALDSDAYILRIRHTYSAKQGLQSPFVFWGLLTEELLDQALHCLPASHLRIWFERLLADIRANRAGMPDLIQFWPQQRRYRMIEVKGPGDRLQDNQKRWLALCAQHGMPVQVCHVQWSDA